VRQRLIGEEMVGTLWHIASPCEIKQALTKLNAASHDVNPMAAKPTLLIIWE
jgi:hypothetical protein